MSNISDEFLTSIGATLAPGSHCEFNGTILPASSNNIIAPLTHYGILAIEGPDTATFLQGQTTCNISEVNQQHSLPGAYCTAKGRLVSNFHIASTNNEQYFLRMRREIVDNTKTVLDKYIVFSKAQQHDASDDFIILGLQGDRAAAAIAQAFGATPHRKHESLVKNGNIAIALDDTNLRYECWIQRSDIDQLWPQLSRDLSPVSSKAWEQLTIQLGLGEITQNTAEMFIPQMLNFHLTGEISFDKGCYTGQEVVARMHYRGKLKRQMYRIEINTGLPPKPATELYRAKAGQSIGNIVNAININATTCEALAVITIDDADNNSVFIAPDLIPVKILSLPYAINTKDS